MLPAIIVFVYLAVVLYIGIFAFRRGTASREDFFLANRKLGPAVFLLSLFGTNMTAVAIWAVPDSRTSAASASSG
jgi:Na+/proline symporter